MKNFFTFFALILCSFSAFSQTVYMETDFEDGLPTGWTIDEDWQIDLPAAVESQFFPVSTVTGGNVACFNDDGLGNGHIGGGAITTSIIDLSDADGTVYLTMDSYFPNVDYGGLDETAKISISTDMGASYTELVDLSGGDSDFAYTFYDISSYIGEMIMIQFAYDDGAAWNYGWALDNIKVSNEVLDIPMFDYAIHAGSSVMMNQALEGVEYHNSGYIFNNGLATITSYDLEMSNGTDVITSSVTGVEIPYNTFAFYSIEEGIVVGSGNQTWTVSISNVNGEAAADGNTADNAMSFNLNAISNVHPDKAVVVEEGTGTWCQFCPRGTVFMEEMSKRFGKHFVGIAVHNNDPMVLAAYNSAVTSFPGFTGFPGAIYQRESVIDPSDIVSPSLADMQIAPPAAIKVGAAIDGDNLTTSIEVTFLEDVSEEYKVAIVLSEDGLSGTAGSWGQVNAYSGGGQAMGGFELLPSNVAGLTYNHVGRALIGGFNGVSGQISGDYVTGNVDGYVFNEYNAAALNMDNVHINALLINSDGEIVNAKSASLAEAMDNGLFVSSTKDVYDSNLAVVFPNPVTTKANIQISLEEAAEVTVTLVNALGQTVGVTQYGKLSGNNQLEFDMNAYAEGIYLMHVQADNRFFSKKLSKIK